MDMAQIVRGRFRRTPDSPRAGHSAYKDGRTIWANAEALRRQIEGDAQTRHEASRRLRAWLQARRRRTADKRPATIIP